VVGMTGQAKQNKRIKSFDEFAEVHTGVPTVIICTDGVMARGIDIPDLDLVIHYQCPINTAVFVHRSGRTARGVGKPGRTVCMDYDTKKASLWRAIFKGFYMSFDTVTDSNEEIALNSFQKDKMLHLLDLAKNIVQVTDSQRTRRIILENRSQAY